MARLLAVAVSALLAAGAPASAKERLTFWDLKLGTPVAKMPDWEEFKGYACGTNGGPPSIPLKGWEEFAKCKAEPTGLHEVYFEYDDEQEYIARAQEMVNDLTRVAGTNEAGFPIVASALFDDQGVLRGIRIVTDPRPDNRPDNFYVNFRDRSQFNQLAAVEAPRLNIDPANDCRKLPLAEGESPVGDTYVKLNCDKVDTVKGLHIVMQSRLYRKPGQTGVNPFVPGQLTEGQYEASTRIEMYQIADGRDFALPTSAN